MKPFFTHSLIIFLLSLSYCYQAKGVGVSSLSQATQIVNRQQPMMINPLINQFAEISFANKFISTEDLKIIDDLGIILNPAEQYLVLILHANNVVSDKYNPTQHLSAIKWLDEAKKLEGSIGESQLNSPLFSQLYLMMSKNYVAINEYELAFVERKYYQEKADADWNYEKDNAVKILNNKYKTDRKIKENELLQNQTKLKNLQIKQTEIQHRVLVRNFFIFICIAILCLLLMVRQIKIRHVLKHLAQTDSLTGLLNRGALFEKGIALTEQAFERKNEMTAFLLDLDHFKQVNENYGHNIGDKVLKTIAILGCETMRSRDIFARLGGEEFVAVLPDANLEEANAIAERLREKICAYDFSECGLTQSITASFGVAALDQVTPKFDAMLNSADEAMYYAKDQGRNKVCSYPVNVR
ncbi:MAG: GGDEF domain-containing protein [Alteromonadaceae bacterium]|nr:GGDEF domain-containing protein [Alteromonadaceae bacterium]